MRRIPELDALRGLAAVSVVAFHAWPTVFFLGWAGVDLFFVLSGFLITSIILEQHHDPRFLRIFYFRRLLRIWPVYFSVLAAVLVLNAFAPTPWPTEGLPWHVVFLQNVQRYAGQDPPGFIYSFYPSWSVALEEQFYLLWPALLAAFAFRRVTGLVALMISASIALRIAGLHEHLLLARFDGLSAGALLAQLLRHEPSPAQRHRLRRVLLLIGALSLAYLAVYAARFWRSPVTHWQPSLFAATSGAALSLIGLVVLASGSPALRLLRRGSLLRLGLISYALYMWHMPVLNYVPGALERLGMTSAVLVNAITWPLVFGIPVASYWLLEKPVMRWRRLLPYQSELR